MVTLDHLALVVTDLERSRRFYETYFDFDRGPASTYDDGTLIIRNPAGFALALHPVPEVPRPHGFSHFGFTQDDPGGVRDMRALFERDGVEIVEVNEEPAYVGFKCLDPDGHKIEVVWEAVGPAE